MKKFLAIVLALCMVAALGAAAYAEFPEGQITVVCPYAPGGASDTAARIYAQMLQGVVGVPVVVDNQTGANGSIGMAAGAGADPDGYTITYMPVESVLNKLGGIGEVSSDDFTFLALADVIPAAITVRANDDRFTDFESFINYAKENPGEVSVGNSGAKTSIWFVAAACLQDTAGIELNNVAYSDGAAAAIAALQAGDIDAVSVSAAEVSTLVIDGELKTLAILGDTHSSAVGMEEIPTATELGYPVSVSGWGGFAVPKDTPADIVAFLEEASEKAINSDEMLEVFTSRGYEPYYLNSADAGAFAKEQLDYFTDLLAE
ncbi:MAG: tripartite tricarboxylate transporter substrate binding protein [Eubacteriales bacterium]|nr:tripartite tricarboxylate transporter substrate binding protein [Eubacteriales bacterium]